MPYMDNLPEYHERKKDGTPTDTPHPHGKKKESLIKGAKTGAGLLGTATLVVGAGLLKRRLKTGSFGELADSLHKFDSSKSAP